MRACGRVDRQRQIDKEFAEEEPAAAVLVDQAGVLADPAQAGIARQRALEHRRGIDEHAVPEGTDVTGDVVRELLQAVAHQLVVVAAQRVARDVGTLGVVQGGPRLGIFLGAVVQPDRNHPHRAGQQFLRPRAHCTVPRHPLHRSVQALAQPIGQVCLVLAQLDAADAAALETGLPRKLANAQRQLRQVGGGNGFGHGASIESPA